MSKEELADRVIASELRLDQFAQELAQLKKLVFGQSRERFVAEVPDNQLSMDLGQEQKQEVPEQTEEITYSRKKKARKEKPVRQALPAHLPRKEEIILPEGDLEDAVKIGQDVTEILECRQAKYWVRRIVRPKYAWPKQEERGVVIAPMPSRPIDKCIAGESLLAMIIVEKYADHLPLYRQIQRMKRLGLKIPISTLCGWIGQSCDLLDPLYRVLIRLVLECGYLMVDETGIRVLERLKKSKAHLGYHWIYMDPVRGLVLFDYRPTRSRAGPEKLLAKFSGYLQTDGYKAYDKFETGSYPGITVLGCMAHARRKFHESLKNDPERAKQALGWFRQLYAIEREAKERDLNPAERYALRQEQALPVLSELETWLKANLTEVTPKSIIGKAITYSLGRWEKLCNYTLDGKLEIDNNLAENAIRPIALGRKNYLFAGSHQGAHRAAMLYSFLATCKRHDINPTHWLEDVLGRIKEHPVNRLEELLPHKWKPQNTLSNDQA